MSCWTRSNGRQRRELHVDLVIHYDPIVTDDPEVAAVRTRVLQIMHGLTRACPFMISAWSPGSIM